MRQSDPSYEHSPAAFIRQVPVIAFALATLLYGCAQQPQAKITGHYHAVSPGRLSAYADNFIFHKRYVISTTLDLKKDSSYILQTCAMTDKGRWQLDSGRLYLHCAEKMFRIDSFNHLAEWRRYTICKDQPLVFSIKGARLNCLWGKDENKAYYLIMEPDKSPDSTSARRLTDR